MVQCKQPTHRQTLRNPLLNDGGAISQEHINRLLSIPDVAEVKQSEKVSELPLTTQGPRVVGMLPRYNVLLFPLLAMN